MGFELEKRLATELNRLAEDPSFDRSKPTKDHVERIKRIAAELKARLLASQPSEDLQVGKRTNVDDMVADAVRRFETVAARARFEMLP